MHAFRAGDDIVQVEIIAGSIIRGTSMLARGSVGLIAAVAALCATIVGASAFDDARYPDWKGQWTRARVPGAVGQPPHDPSKPVGRGQQAPLTAEYQAKFEANLADQAAGGQGTSDTYACLPNGMPRMMNAYEPIEFVVTPDITYILVDHIEHTRRVYTDGRDWPEEIEPSWVGYSIGKWIDTDGDGRYDVLEVESRGFKGPRAYDASGLPLHLDNESVFRERIYLDKGDPKILRDEITTIDHALTRPWTVTKSYVRNPYPKAVWAEWICGENNPHVVIGKDNFFLSADGLLMPARKDQAPPDLRYFNRTKK
jgi:hypothetical protein